MRRRKAKPGVSPASYPLSELQQRFWLMNRLHPDDGSLHLFRAVRIRGELEPAALHEALEALVERHAMLRTGFHTRGAEPVQTIEASAQLDSPFFDLGDLPKSEREAEARLLAAQTVQRPFDLSSPPLLRSALMRLSDDEHVVVLVSHPIAADGWSLGVLLRDLGALYGAALEGKQSPLGAAPPHYAEIVRAELESLSPERLSRELDYWRPRLEGAPGPLELPHAAPRGPRERRRGARHGFRLPGRLVRSLRELGRRREVSDFAILLTGFQCLLHRYSGETDLVVGTPLGHREREGSDALVGPLETTLVLRSDLSGDPGFGELLDRVKQVATEALAHRSLSLETLQRELSAGRNLPGLGAYQIQLAFQETSPGFEVAGLSAEPLELDAGTAGAELALLFSRKGEELCGVVEYDAGRVETDAVERMTRHLCALLEAAAADPDQRLSALPLLSRAEQQQIEGWNQTRVAFRADACLHHLFEEQARRRPQAVAAVFEGRRLSYAALDRQANRLARHLRARGVGPGVMTPICVHRSLDMLVGLLGILKAGGAYVPMDPRYPAERLAFMLEDCRAPLLVTEGAVLPELPPDSGPRVCLDLDRESIEAESGDALNGGAAPEDLAYLIYTSGSTGRPKGVEIQHRAAVNFLEAMAREPGLDERDTLLAVTTLCFDIALLELLGPLCVGGRVALLSSAQASDAGELGAALRESRATVMQATPATWRMLLEAGWSGEPELKALCGGEALSADLAQQLRDCCASLWNLYGPTEATVWAAASRVDAIEVLDAGVPIGGPIANLEFHVLDPGLRPVPIGVPGELYIGGVGLARGYHRRPELDAESFVPHPFGDEPGARLYRSGDRVRRLPDGELAFLGRLDQQVKLRGFRIELGEIEAALLRHPRVRRCAAALRETDPGDARLVAYLVCDGSAPDPAELRSHLQQTLPEHMLPSAYVELEALPLTPNGKLDRSALPAARSDAAAGARAPRTPLEVRLARLWEELLGHPVGVRDDFFESGGHSLLAVRLFHQIEERLGQVLPIATIFETPTIEGLAARIDGPVDAETRWPVLVPLQEGGSRPPFFFVAGAEHHPGAHLGAEQPVFRVQVQDLDRPQPFTRVEEMAAHALESIRAVQPSGPYRLGGHCFGGLVAYEMAQQLRRDGESVVLLALLDTHAPGSFRAADLPVWKRLGLRIAYQRRQARQLGVLRAVGRLGGQMRRKARQVAWKVLGRLGASLGRKPRPRDPRAANFMARRRYRPEPYPGALTVIAPTERPAWDEIDPLHGWGPLAGSVEMHDVCGTHRSMYREPRVEQLAEILNECLRRAGERPGR